jgi:hypothetical protein
LDILYSRHRVAHSLGMSKSLTPKLILLDSKARKLFTSSAPRLRQQNIQENTRKKKRQKHKKKKNISVVGARSGGI